MNIHSIEQRQWNEQITPVLYVTLCYIWVSKYTDSPAPSAPGISVIWHFIIFILYFIYFLNYADHELFNLLAVTGQYILMQVRYTYLCS